MKAHPWRVTASHRRDCFFRGVNGQLCWIIDGEEGLVWLNHARVYQRAVSLRCNDPKCTGRAYILEREIWKLTRNVAYSR